MVSYVFDSIVVVNWILSAKPSPSSLISFNIWVPCQCDDLGRSILSGRPWIITSARGQHINLTVYDFTVNLGSGGQLMDELDSKHGVGMTPCRQYAVVEDAGRDVTLCGGFRGRFGSTYLSTGYTVKLWMTAGQAQNQLHRFLVHYRSELVKR